MRQDYKLPPQQAACKKLQAAVKIFKLIYCQPQTKSFCHVDSKMSQFLKSTIVTDMSPILKDIPINNKVYSKIIELILYNSLNIYPSNSTQMDT